MPGYVYRGAAAAQGAGQGVQDELTQLRAQLERSQQDRATLYDRLQQSRRHTARAEEHALAQLEQVRRANAEVVRSYEAAAARGDRSRARASASAARVRSLLGQLREARWHLDDRERAVAAREYSAQARTRALSFRVRSLLAQLREAREVTPQQPSASVGHLERRVGQLQGALSDQLQIAADARADRDRALRNASVMQEALDAAHTSLTSFLPEFWAVRRHAREVARRAEETGTTAA